MFHERLCNLHLDEILGDKKWGINMKPTGLENIREEKFWQEANARKKSKEKNLAKIQRQEEVTRKHEIRKIFVICYLLPIALNVLSTFSSLLITN